MILSEADYYSRDGQTTQAFIIIMILGDTHPQAGREANRLPDLNPNLTLFQSKSID